MNNKEFGNYIRDIRKARYSSRDAMSKEWVWHKNSIQNYEDGTRLPDIDYLAALAISTGHSFEELVRKRLEVGHIPDKAHLLAWDKDQVQDNPTNTNLAVPLYNSQELIVVDEKLVPHSNIESLLFFKVGGDSMIPTIADNEIILLDTSEKALKEGSVIVIKMRGDFYVRRVQVNFNDSFTLACDNPLFNSSVVTKSDLSTLEVIGTRVNLTLSN